MAALRSAERPADSPALAPSPRTQVVHPPSVIGPRTHVSGTIAGNGPLTVRGEVEGKISLSDRLVLAPESRVQADVEATTIEVLGQLRGSLRAHTSMRIVPPGWFEGDAVTPRAHVGLGAVVRGGLLIRSSPPRRPA